ncbi:MAG: hypothetical protein H6Q17_726 [Bacteroidetes bacterium]|jgi:membrane protein DedA with SNARE-associated domain|nr:hypothetical protein [Bacteroidota bacterium]
MPDDLVFYISHYGYLAIFLIVFLQEVGAPTPLPNELILIFAGYLVFTGIFKSGLVILSVIGGDLLAAAILYIVFHLFGIVLLNKKLRWIQLPQQHIKKQSQRIARLGLKGIVIGRLSPFIRGYVAVICGLLHINPKRYALTILITSTLWGSSYIMAGYLLGPYWEYVNMHIDSFKYILISIPVGIALWLSIRFIFHLISNRHITNSL